MLEEALKRLRQGDNSALDEIYEETKQTVFSVAYSYTRNYQSAEDVSQETYINILRYILYYKPNTNPKAWIIQIVKNASLNYLKKIKNLKTANIDEIYGIAGEETADKNTEAREIVKLVEENLDEVSSKIVIMHLVGGMTFEEISAAADINSSTLRWKYGKAIKKLEKVFRENGYE